MGDYREAFTMPYTNPVDHEEKFFEKVRIDEETGCWLWLPKHRDKQGYGRYRGQAPSFWSYVHFKRRKPVGRLKPTCTNNFECVNPEHWLDKEERGVVVDVFSEADAIRRCYTLAEDFAKGDLVHLEIMKENIDRIFAVSEKSRDESYEEYVRRIESIARLYLVRTSRPSGEE